MRFPRRWMFWFSASLLLLIAAVSAQAARRPPKVLHPIPVRSVSEAQGESRKAQATGCDLGVTGGVNAILDFILPAPDPDIYYSLVQVSDCAECATADTALFDSVYVSLELRTNCAMPVQVFLVGAGGMPLCPTPQITNFLYPPTDFLLPAVSQVPDTAEFIFALPSRAMVVGKAFLAVAFLDTVSGCADSTTRPRLVLSDANGGCVPCKSWNDFDFDGMPNDMCFPDRLGNPLMSAKVDSCFPIRDLVAPAAVTDLDVDSTGFSGVKLAWTATGDDATTGQAVGYEIRRASFVIDDTNFGTADSLVGTPAPSAAGSVDRYVATGLTENTSYTFALKVIDDSGNRSALSNVVAATTGAGLPAPVTDLSVVSTTPTGARLQWTATGDDGDIGRPVRYLIAVSTLAITEASFFASVRDSADAMVDPDDLEFLDIAGLARSTDYRFALKALDDAGNFSALSNVASGRTQVGGPIDPQAGIAIASLEQPARLPVQLFWQGPGGVVSGPQSIRIHDLGGRMVRTIDLPLDASGVVQWDGKNDDGADLPAGVYVARLTSGSSRAKARVVLLK